MRLEFFVPDFQLFDPVEPEKPETVAQTAPGHMSGSYGTDSRVIEQVKYNPIAGNFRIFEFYKPGIYEKP